MKVLILFSVICVDCGHANDWHMEDDVELAPNGYRIRANSASSWQIIGQTR
jgi:hypothetical protein